jgi:hypothetical protein
MANKIQATISAVFPGGLNVTATRDIPTEAYDKIDAVIAAGKNRVVQIQPADTAQLKFLLITSDTYSDKLTYSVGEADSQAADRTKLDWAQMFVGSGMLSLIKESPKKLRIYNDTNADVAIQVLVGRTAIVQA